MSILKINYTNILKQLFLITLTFILIGFSTIKSEAATYTQTQTCTLNLQITNWNRSCTLPKFNPSLGVLQSVRFELAANINSTASVESRDMSATTVTTNVSANITLLRPDNSIITVVLPTTNTSTNFTPYDGTTDYGGTSGAVLPNLLASQSSIVTSTSPADLALFSGSGNIITPVTATGLSSFTGSANLATLVDTQAAASVNVIYSYLAQDLSLNKTHAGIFTVGTPGVYNLTVTNKESSPTSGTITVADTLPAGLSFISNSNADWSCSAVGQVLTCSSVTAIASNGTSNFFITVNVANSTLSSITNTAQVSSDLVDPVSSDNTSSDPTTVNHLPTLTNSTVNPITPGSTVNLPSTSITANPNDISDSIVDYTITGLPNPLVGTIYLGNPSLGGTVITVGQVLTPADISNIYFQSIGNASATTGFTYTARDSLGGISSTTGTVNLSVVNNPSTASPTVITSNPSTSAASTVPTLKSTTADAAIASPNPITTNSVTSTNQANNGSVLGVNEIIKTTQNLIRTGTEAESELKFIMFGLIGVILLYLNFLSLKQN